MRELAAQGDKVSPEAKELGKEIKEIAVVVWVLQVKVRSIVPVEV